MPKHVRERFETNRDVEKELGPTKGGQPVRKRTTAQHPVDRVAGILDGADFDVDEYIEEIRGR